MSEPATAQPWAKPEPLGEGDTFETLHRGLTVHLIMTPRHDLVTCRPDEPAAEVVARNTERFDFLPVQRAEDGHIESLFHATAHDAPPGTVREHAHALSEPWLISANASILDFVTTADSQPCRLVVTGTRISGLVAKSDLQRLPVRAALFALITGLELTMTEAIRADCRDDWRRHLSESRRRMIADRFGAARSADLEVDELLYAQFCDKKEIVVKAVRTSWSNERLRWSLRAAEKLRNDVAHANDYADTPGRANEVCEIVRTIIDLREHLRGLAHTASTVGGPGAER